MTTQEKKDKIRAMAIQCLEDSHAAMIKNIDKALNCGGIDIESWSENDAPYILPKAIVTAALVAESTQFHANGTRYEKEFKSTVKNLRYFI